MGQSHNLLYCPTAPPSLAIIPQLPGVHCSYPLFVAATWLDPQRSQEGNVESGKLVVFTPVRKDLHLLIVAIVVLISLLIIHGGSFDVTRHLASSKHHEMLCELKSFFQASSNEEEVTPAEILFAGFIAEHNLPFMIADHFSHLAPVMSNVLRQQDS